MTPLSTTTKGALLGLALIAAPFLAPAIPALAWDEPNIPLACGEKSTINLTQGQSAGSRFDNPGHTSATVIVFLDSAKLEAEGHALRHHYSSTGPLKVTITTTKVTISGPECPPPPPPPIIELPCGEQYYIPFDPTTQSYKVVWLKANRNAVKVIVSGKNARTYEFWSTPSNGHYEVRWLKTQKRVDVHHGCN